MASPRKALLTIHVGDEQILIPFRVDLTVGDLLAEATSGEGTTPMLIQICITTVDEWFDSIIV